MPAETQFILLTVIAGYAGDGTLDAIKKRWIQSVRLQSHYLILVFDQDQLSCLDLYKDDDNVVFICRKHGAYDFGSYQIGIQEAKRRQWFSDASHLLLCNDSVIGPFFDLQHLFVEMISEPAPVWGLTESYLYRPHLQSYFLLMEMVVAQHPSICEFFDAVIPQPSRHHVIQSYELGLSSKIKELGFWWRSWLSASDMYDPRNGELMGNVTAYPVCTLEYKLPVIKARSLKDYSANLDGLGKTCSAISEFHSDIWYDLWSSSKHRRLWQEAIPVSIILDPTDIPVLSHRMEWIKQHPHPNLKCMLAVRSSEIKMRSELMKLYSDEIVQGDLSILICDCPADSDQALLQLIAAAGTPWIVASCHELWQDFSSLQLQLKRIAANPSSKFTDEDPAIFRREELFIESNFKDFRFSLTG